MKREFIKKVISERTVDTRKYRYLARTDFEGIRIYRIALKELNTTADWELVYKEVF